MDNTCTYWIGYRSSRPQVISLHLLRGPARVNSDKRHDPKSSNKAENEMATSDNLPLPNCDSDGKAENMRQRTVVWLIYHQSECLEEVIFVNFPCASEVVSRQGVSVDPPERVALARRVVFIYATPHNSWETLGLGCP